jgi:hypothetical protein
VGKTIRFETAVYCMIHKLFYLTTLKTHNIRKVEATCKIVAVHSMKAYRQSSRCIAPFILNLSII